MGLTLLQVLNSNLMIPDFSHSINIRLAPLKEIVTPWSCKVSAKLRQQTGLDSGINNKNFQWGQCYLYFVWKVLYHQIWIQNYLGFIVIIVMHIQYSTVLPWIRFWWKKIVFWKKIQPILNLLLKTSQPYWLQVS